MQNLSKREGSTGMNEKNKNKENEFFIFKISAASKRVILPYNGHMCYITLVQEQGFTIQDENTTGHNLSVFSIARPLPSAHMASKTC